MRLTLRYEHDFYNMEKREASKILKKWVEDWEKAGYRITKCWPALPKRKKK